LAAGDPAQSLQSKLLEATVNLDDPSSTFIGCMFPYNRHYIPTHNNDKQRILVKRKTFGRDARGVSWQTTSSELPTTQTAVNVAQQQVEIMFHAIRR
jgi:hypothetical protein